MDGRLWLRQIVCKWGVTVIECCAQIANTLFIKDKLDSPFVQGDLKKLHQQTSLFWLQMSQVCLSVHKSVQAGKTHQPPHKLVHAYVQICTASADSSTSIQPLATSPNSLPTGWQMHRGHKQNSNKRILGISKPVQSKSNKTAWSIYKST